MIVDNCIMVCNMEVCTNLYFGRVTLTDLDRILTPLVFIQVILS